MPEAVGTTRQARLKLLLALEVARILRDLHERVDFLVTIWSRHRNRDPFLDTLFSRWRTLSASDLAELDEEAIVRLHVFYDEIESFRLYLEYTEDMPTMLRDRFEKRLRRVEQAARPAIEALGGMPERGLGKNLPTIVLDAPPES